MKEVVAKLNADWEGNPRVHYIPAGSFHAVGQANAVYVDESQVFGITGRPAVLGGLRSLLGGRFHRRNEYR